MTISRILIGILFLSGGLFSQTEIRFPDDLFDESAILDSQSTTFYKSTNPFVFQVKEAFSYSNLYIGTDLSFNNDTRKQVKKAYREVHVLNGLQQVPISFNPTRLPILIGYRVWALRRTSAFVELTWPVSYRTEADVQWYIYSGTVTHTVNYRTIRLGGGYSIFELGNFLLRAAAGIESQQVTLKSRGTGGASVDPTNQTINNLAPFIAIGTVWKPFSRFAIEANSRMVFSNDLRIKQHALKFAGATAYAYQPYRIGLGGFSMGASLVVGMSK